MSSSERNTSCEAVRAWRPRPFLDGVQGHCLLPRRLLRDPCRSDVGWRTELNCRDSQEPCGYGVGSHCGSVHARHPLLLLPHTTHWQWGGLPVSAIGRTTTREGACRGREAGGRRARSWPEDRPATERSQGEESSEFCDAQPAQTCHGTRRSFRAVTQRGRRERAEAQAFPTPSKPSGATEPKEAVADGWEETVEAVRAPERPRKAAVPGAAAKHHPSDSGWWGQVTAGIARVGFCVEPIGTPLPHVPAHVHVTPRAAAFRVGRHRTGLLLATVPVMAASVWLPTATPRVRTSINSPRCFLPLQLSGQTEPRPFTVGLRSIPADVYNWVVAVLLDVVHSVLLATLHYMGTSA